MNKRAEGASLHEFRPFYTQIEVINADLPQIKCLLTIFAMKMPNRQASLRRNRTDGV